MYAISVTSFTNKRFFHRFIKRGGRIFEISIFDHMNRIIHQTLVIIMLGSLWRIIIGISKSNNNYYLTMSKLEINKITDSSNKDFIKDVDKFNFSKVVSIFTLREEFELIFHRKKIITAKAKMRRMVWQTNMVIHAILKWFVVYPRQLYSLRIKNEL